MKNPTTWRYYEGPSGYYRLKRPTRDVGSSGCFVGWYVSRDGTKIEDCVVHPIDLEQMAVKCAFVPKPLQTRLRDACTC